MVLHGTLACNALASQISKRHVSACGRAGQEGSQILVSLTIDQEPPPVFLYKHWLPMILEISGGQLTVCPMLRMMKSAQLTQQSVMHIPAVMRPDL